jgi:hypothetical protein
MLVSRRGAAIQVVTHSDHGRLAGQLAAGWGNQRFRAPMAREALLDAASHHDDGWAELDDVPVHNEAAQRPAHFLELPLEQTVEPYRRGVDSVYARNVHAGALVSMHWAGLYSTRWGLQAGAPVGHPQARQVVADQERRWVAALRESWDYEGPRSRFEADTWHAYEVLQTLDFLALGLSLLDLEQSTGDGEAQPMASTLATVDQPPGARLIASVPTAVGEGHVGARLSVAGRGRVIVDPYPFAAPELAVRLPVRMLEDRAYSAAESAAAYHDAEVQTLTITVAATGAPSQRDM